MAFKQVTGISELLVVLILHHLLGDDIGTRDKFTLARAAVTRTLLQSGTVHP